MWVFALDGSLVNLNRLDSIRSHQRQDGKFVLTGCGGDNPVRLDMYDSQDEAREALILLRNQLNRAVKPPR